MKSGSFLKKVKWLSTVLGFVTFSSFRQRALLTFFLSALLFTQAHAMQGEISGPAGSGAFGSQVVVLPNGNIVVTDPNYSEGGASNIGAVYLYDGATLVIISTLKGGTTNDQVGNGPITVLANGNFVVSSSTWDNPVLVIANVGAVTLCSGTTGCNDVVSASNSLVGSTAGDFIGDVTKLPNSNYVVRSPDWDRPSLAPNAGAVTFCNGTSGCAGAVGASNSLVVLSSSRTSRQTQPCLVYSTG